MMKTNLLAPKKLTLSRTTLRRLSNLDLEGVAGGRDDYSRQCTTALGTRCACDK